MATSVNEAKRQDFYQRIAAKGLTPLWLNMSAMVSPEPGSRCKPVIWHFDEIRQSIMEGGTLITAQEAERRVLMLENPGFDQGHRVTNSLYAGIQLVMPGETAPNHRHVANALRFIIEGTGAYTGVNGERTILHPGDFVVTPGWTWHEHGNNSPDPVIWMDGLDVHLVNLLDASFMEGEGPEDVKAADDLSYVSHGYNMLPVDYTRGAEGKSPIFNYPYSVSRDVLDKMSRSVAPDVCHGFKMKFIDPTTGDWAMPTIAVYMQLLPRGFVSQPYRATDGTIFSVVEGTGHSVIAGQRFDWRQKDIFVVPSWHSVQHFPDEEAVLFSYSDRATQEKLGFWREQRGNHRGG
jgi:gentisate 1,2-dioxygenase